MTTHSRILAWRIPWMEESGRPQFIGSQRVGHDWRDWAHTLMYRRDFYKLVILNQWNPTYPSYNKYFVKHLFPPWNEFTENIICTHSYKIKFNCNVVSMRQGIIERKVNNNKMIYTSVCTCLSPSTPEDIRQESDTYVCACWVTSVVSDSLQRCGL